MADRIAVIASGVIQQVGKPWEIYHKPRNVFVASFIGTPPANLVTVNLDRSRKCLLLPGGGRYCPPRHIAEKLAAVDSDSIILGFRPESVVLSESPLGDYVSIEAEVYTVETLGRENIVTLIVGNSQVKAIVPPVVEPKPGSRIYISIEEDKVMYFDPKTEINIEYLEAPGMEEAIAEPMHTPRKQDMEEG